MKTNKIKYLILRIIIITFVINMALTTGVNANGRVLSISEAKAEAIMISRYILANENKDVKSAYPSWAILSTKEIVKLDKNEDKKIDVNDLLKIKRHILAMENSAIGNQYPGWIIYEEEVEKITLNKTTLTINNKAVATLKTTITPENAVDKTITWSSSNTALATVDANGKVTAKKAGIVTITAESNNGKTANCKITIVEPVTGVKLNKTSTTIYTAKTETLKATISPSNATNKAVIWSTSNSAIATVSNGKVTAKKAGTATITVKTSNGKTASCKVTIKNPIVAVTGVKLNKSSTIINTTKAEKLSVTIFPSNATNKAVTWSTSNSAIATVSNGKVTAKKAGTATITVKSANEKVAKCKVTVKNKITSIKLDRKVLMLDNEHYDFAELTATPNPNLKSTVTWSSSNSKIATVDKNGKVVGKKYGTAKITATIKNYDGTSVNATCNVRVITKSSDSSVGKKRTYRGAAFYLVDDKWTNAEVESYINNAAILLKKYPDKYSEGQKISVRYYYGGNAENYWSRPSRGDSRLYTYPYGRSEHSVVKPRGQLDINGYVLFFSTKKQWIYLLKKNSDGTFKVVKEEQSSGGPNYESQFDAFLAGIHTSTELGSNKRTDMHAIYKMGRGNRSLYTNSVHLRTNSRISN